MRIPAFAHPNCETDMRGNRFLRVGLCPISQLHGTNRGDWQPSLYLRNTSQKFRNEEKINRNGPLRITKDIEPYRKTLRRTVTFELKTETNKSGFRRFESNSEPAETRKT
jgi:hypothetical protein